MTQQGPTPPGSTPPGAPPPAGSTPPPGAGPTAPGAASGQVGQQQPTVQSPTAPKQLSGPLPRAEFVQRLGAFAIDIVILFVAYLILQLIVGGIITALATTSSSAAIAIVAAILGVLLFLVEIALPFLYFYFQERQPSGQTLGKRALNIRVVDFNTGGSLSGRTAMTRSLSRYLSALPIYLGYFWMLWDPEQQTWHDKLAGTTVVPVSSYPIP